MSDILDETRKPGANCSTHGHLWGHRNVCIFCGIDNPAQESAPSPQLFTMHPDGFRSIDHPERFIPFGATSADAHHIANLQPTAPPDRDAVGAEPCSPERREESGQLTA